FAALDKLKKLKKLKLYFFDIDLTSFGNLSNLKSLPSLEELALCLTGINGFAEKPAGSDLVRFITSGFPNLRQLALFFYDYVRNSCTHSRNLCISLIFSP